MSKQSHSHSNQKLSDAIDRVMSDPQNKEEFSNILQAIQKKFDGRKKDTTPTFKLMMTKIPS